MRAGVKEARRKVAKDEGKVRGERQADRALRKRADKRPFDLSSDKWLLRQVTVDEKE